MSHNLKNTFIHYINLRRAIGVLLLPMQIMVSTPTATEYAGEPFLMNLSVPLNSTARTLPTHMGFASEIIQFPANFHGHNYFNGELAALNLFGGLSNALYGAVSIPLDTNLEVTVYGAMVVTDNIGIRPILNQNSDEERFTDPGIRPDYCEDPCDAYDNFTNGLYLAYFNIKRRFQFLLPRFDFSSSPTPFSITTGTNIKYFKDEAEGLDYVAQNINMDIALQVKLEAGYDHFKSKSSFDIYLDIAAMEVLQTQTSSQFANEKVETRYNYALYADKTIQNWNSKIRLGVHQKAEWGKYPGIAGGVFYKDIVGLNMGYHADFISSGLVIKYRHAGLAYTLDHHELGTSPYQVSLFFESPWKFY